MSEAILGIIGGTGFESNLASILENTKRERIKTPFGLPSDDILIGELNNVKVAYLNRHGKGHKFSPTAIPYRANIFALKKLGARFILSTAAVGSLKENVNPTELVIVDQFIDKTFKRNTSFFNEHAAVHCEMAEPTCTRINGIILDSIDKDKLKVHSKGTYVCMEGPQFSTKAESKMHRKWGGDLIGMTAMPEAKLAREAQMCYSQIALVTDYDCWKEEHTSATKEDLLKEIIGNLKQASENTLTLIKKFLENTDRIFNENCTCRNSLKLANMTDEEMLDKKTWKKMEVLFE